MAVGDERAHAQLVGEGERLMIVALGLLDLYSQERFAKLPAVFNEGDAENLWQTVLERVRTKTYDEWTAVFAQHEDLAVERIRGPLESLEHSRKTRRTGDFP